jgi:hypothetical protein
VLTHDVVSDHSTPISAADILGYRNTSRIRQCCPTYTMPTCTMAYSQNRVPATQRGTSTRQRRCLSCCGKCAAFVVMNRRRQSVITSTNGLDATPEPGCTTRSR